MLKIRLQKIGKKNAPSFRVVLAEHTSKPQGKFIEILGFYNPRLKNKGFKKERIEHWLSKGAQPSPTVYNLLVDEKIIETGKLKAWRPKKRVKARPSEVPSEGGKKDEVRPETEALEEPKIEESNHKEKTEQSEEEKQDKEELKSEEADKGESKTEEKIEEKETDKDKRESKKPEKEENVDK